MDKKEFIQQLAKITGLSIQEARMALNTCLDLIVSVNSRQEKITFNGFGTFEVVDPVGGRHHQIDDQGHYFEPIFLPEQPFIESLS